MPDATRNIPTFFFSVQLKNKDSLLFDTLAQAMGGIVYGAEKRYYRDSRLPEGLIPVP